MANEGHVKIGTELDESAFKKGLSGLGNLAKTGLATVGKVATAAIGAATTAVTAFGAASVKTGMDFDAAVSQIAATMGVTTAEIGNLRDKAKELGASTSFSATQAAEGLNILAMSGLNAEQQIGAIEPVLNLAAAGTLSLESAASYATGTMKGFGLEVEDVAHITNLMAKGATLANTDVSGLGEALSGAAAGASTYGQSVETTTVSLLRLAEQNQTGSAAATALAAAMKNLYAPTDQAKKALSSLGVSAYDTAGNARDFNDVVDDLNAKLSNLTTEERADLETTIFGIQGKDAFDSMVKTSTDKVESFKKSLAGADTEGNGIGSAASQAATQLDNLKGDITIFQSALEGLQIEISDSLSGSAREFVQFGTDTLTQLTDAFTSNGVDGLVDAGAGIVIDFAAGIVGEIPGLIDIGADIILKLLSALQSNLGSLASVGMDIISSLASGVVGFMPQLFDIGGQLLQMLYDGVIAGIPLLFNAAADMANNMASGLDEKIPEFIDKALDMVQTFATTLAENAPVLISAGINLLSNLVKGIVDSLPTMIGKLPQIISTFANIINDNAPTILQAGINLIVTLVQGIISAVPTLIANIPQIIQAIVDVWSAFNWIDLGRNAITFLQKGILGMAGAVKSAGTSILNGITGSLKQLPGKLLSLGKSGISSLGSALKGGLSTVTGHAKSILKGIIDSFKPNSLLEVGKNLIKGLWKGIASMSGWILKQIKGFCDSVVDGMKDFFDIHSPSRRMAKEVGKPVAEGTAKGITDNLDVVEAATDEMGETILESGKETAELVGEQMEDSLQSEESYWNSMVAATRRGVLGQKDAVASLVDTKSDMLTNVTALYNNYISKLGETTDELMKATGLFDEVTKKTGVNSDTLMKNLQDQVNMYGEYWTVMQQLKSRITNEGLLSALEDMGVDSLAELQALNSMTDDELAQYAALYDQKYAMCNAIAADSLSELRSQTETELAKMLGVTNVNLDEFARTFDGTLDSIELYIEQTVTDVGELQDAMYDNGQNIMAGLIDGMESMKDDLEKTTAEMIEIAAKAAKDAGEIKSPSRLFRRLIGRNIIAGINVGMEDETDSLEATSRDMVARSVKAMQQTDAGATVARFQSQSSRRSEVTGSDDPWKYPKDPGYDAPASDTPQTLVLEKGSIEGEVIMEGQKVGKIVAPTVDKELGVISRGKERKK